MGWFRTILDGIRSAFAVAPPCAACGKPSTGFGAEVVGKLPWQPEGQQQPGTKLYLSNPKWYCAEHLKDVTNGRSSRYRD